MCVMRNGRLLVALLVIVVPSTILVLAELVIGDYKLFMLINQGVTNSVLDVLCAYASPISFSAFYLLTLAKLYVSHNNRFLAIGVISLVTGPVSYGIGFLMKPFFARPRPFEVLADARVIGPWETGNFSFPSTTTMLAFGLALQILLLSEKRHYGIILSILSYFIGFSVIYAGFHFPADVAAGIILSFCIAACTSRMKEITKSILDRICAREIVS
ncbi:MAG: phosphatase PAP2 family protein [Candidatus Heimdallarchaeota archaeon]